MFSGDERIPIEYEVIREATINSGLVTGSMRFLTYNADDMPATVEIKLSLFSMATLRLPTDKTIKLTREELGNRGSVVDYERIFNQVIPDWQSQESRMVIGIPEFQWAIVNLPVRVGEAFKVGGWVYRWRGMG